MYSERPGSGLGVPLRVICDSGLRNHARTALHGCGANVANPPYGRVRGHTPGTENGRRTIRVDDSEPGLRHCTLATYRSTTCSYQSAMALLKGELGELGELAASAGGTWSVSQTDRAEGHVGESRLLHFCFF